MRVGIIVDGESEVRALPEIRSTLEVVTGNTILNPVLAKVDPTATSGTISRVVVERLRGLKNRQIGLAVILIDREQQHDCPGDLALRLAESIQQRAQWNGEIKVVVKDRMFENWLIADLGALKRQQGRFLVTAATERKVVPNKADHVPALDLLRASVKVPPAYRKVDDSKRILSNARIDAMAVNSRSFRRFLRCLGHPDYRDQSRLPHTSDT